MERFRYNRSVGLLRTDELLQCHDDLRLVIGRHYNETPEASTSKVDKTDVKDTDTDLDIIVGQFAKLLISGEYLC